MRLGVEIKRRRLPLLWVAVAAAFLLLYVRDLGEKSLWIDELLSLDFAARDLAGVIGAAAADVHPPAYFVLLHYWVKVFGQGDFALRLPSAVFSSLSLVILYRLGKELSGRQVTTIAICFTVASPFFLLFSHMARYYSFALVVSLLSSLLLVLALKRGRPAYWVAYALACSLVLYTDYPTIAVIGAHGVFLIGWHIVRRVAGPEAWFRRGKGDYHTRRWGEGPFAPTRCESWSVSGASTLAPSMNKPVVNLPERQRALLKWLVSVFAAFVSFTPWLALAIGRMAQGSQGRVSDYAQGPAGIAFKLGAFFFSFGVGETIFPWHPLALLAIIAVLTALVFGLVVRRGNDWEPAAFLATLLGCAVISTMFITTLVMPVVTFLNVGSRTMFAFPYFALLVASGLARMGRPAGVAIAIVAASSVASYANYVSGSSFLNPIYTVPSKQIAADVETYARPGDVIITTLDSVFERYYDGAKVPASRHFLASQWDEARSYIEGNQARRVWLLTLGLDTNRDAYPEDVAGWLRNHYGRSELKGYAEQDSFYRTIKEKLLRRESYRFKASLELYEKK